MITLALRYYGCDDKGIFCVLQSYDLGYTMASVAQYIADEKTMEQLDGYWHPERGHAVHTMRAKCQSAGGMLVALDYDHGRPVQMDLTCNIWLPEMAPREMVILQATDGRKISTSVAQGQVSCRIWDQEEVPAPLRRHSV